MQVLSAVIPPLPHAPAEEQRKWTSRGIQCKTAFTHGGQVQISLKVQLFPHLPHVSQEMSQKPIKAGQKSVLICCCFF